MDIWLGIGIALVLWAIYDLINGEVWLHRKIRREYEPKLYWSIWIIWIGIGIIVTLGSL